MFVMDEDGTKMSGPVARKVSLFRRAVLRNRRREQSRETVAARGTDAAAPNAGDAEVSLQSGSSRFRFGLLGVAAPFS